MQQTMSRPNLQSNNNGNSQSQKIIITAITLFALAGLLVGFGFGAITRPVKTAQNTPAIKQSPVAGRTATIQPTPTVDVMTVGVGCPLILSYQVDETITNASNYTFATQIVDKSIENKTACGQGKPLYAADVKCKLWLTRDNNINDTLNNNRDRLKHIDTIAQPIPKEVENALTFSATTPQTQNCSTTGKTTWNYQLSPSLNNGKYYLVVLADWTGQRYNWTFRAINIQKND
jgi:hypothetical protein